MEYTIKAIETKFQGFVFRSRLEAKWAVMFELLGWDWDYEPCDFDGWIPDFAIYGKRPTYVEVKPVVDFPEEIAAKMDWSGCNDSMLIVGQRCLIDKHRLCFGWTKEYGCKSTTYRCNSCEGCELFPNSAWWSEAAFGRWEDGQGKIGFCHADGSYIDHISGGYDGGSYGALKLTSAEIRRMWAHAHNIIRWIKTS